MKQGQMPDPWAKRLALALAAIILLGAATLVASVMLSEG